MSAAADSEPAASEAGTVPATRANTPGSKSTAQLRGFISRPIDAACAACEFGLDAAALLFFPLLVVLPRGIAALVSVAGVCAAGLAVSTGRIRISGIVGVAATLLACLVLWGAASSLWSIDPARSLVVAPRLAGLFGAGLALAYAAGLVGAPQRLMALALVGMALGIAMAAIELATAGTLHSLVSDRAFRPTQLNQASISFALLLFPTAAALVCLGRTASAALLAAGTVLTVYSLQGTAAKFVLFAGLAMGLLLYRLRSLAAWTAAAVTVAAVVSAPLTFAQLERLPGLAAAADGFKISAGHRLLIWSFAGDRIAERPLTGWGLDASRAMPGGADPIRAGETWMPLHPHNAALQLWLELGVPGAVLFAMVAALAWSALAGVEWPPLFAAAAGASLTIALVGCFGTYGIWQEWWLGTLAFCFFLLSVMARAAAGGILERAKPPHAIA